jgi:hypothetical protein
MHIVHLHTRNTVCLRAPIYLFLSVLLSAPIYERGFVIKLKTKEMSRNLVFEKQNCMNVTYIYVLNLCLISVVKHHASSIHYLFMLMLVRPL